MNYLQNLEERQEHLTKNLHSYLAYLNRLQLHVLNQVGLYPSLWTRHLESIQDTVNSISAELEEIKKTLSANS